jgi:hypothetical protein
MDWFRFDKKWIFLIYEIVLVGLWLLGVTMQEMAGKSGIISGYTLPAGCH